MNDLDDERHYSVAKSNEFYRRQEPYNLIWLIQQCGNRLTLAEMKLVSFLISKVKPTDTVLQEYTFSISDFCKVCGITYCGKNYKRVKDMLNSIADKSDWIKDGTKIILFRWIETPVIDTGNGQVTARLNPLLTGYLLDLFKDGRFFQYELVFVLPLKSAYSFRLYELAKSHSHEGNAKLTIKDLKDLLGMPDGYDIKNCMRAIKKSIAEINNYTDLRLALEPIRKGRKIEGVDLSIERLEGEAHYFERSRNLSRTIKELDGDQEQQIPGQMNLEFADKE